MQDLAGRVALVTGAGRGIGRAVALALAAAGADVAAAARTAQQVEETAGTVRAVGRRSLALVCDVTKRAQVESAVAQVARELGPPLILVNNAGTGLSARLEETSDEMWDGMIRTNATGAFYFARAVMPFMRQAGWGRMINVASTAAREGKPYTAAYAASKHALLGLTRAAAAEVAAHGITVNAICPGYADTELTAASIRNIVARTGRTPDEALKALEGFSPQRRLITAEEVASLALFLCSEEARGINGQGLVVDGGGVQG